MRQVFPDLWITEPEFPDPVNWPQLMFHAFLLTRSDGNLLFYRTEKESDHDRIAELGGVRLHYLAHSHEAGPGLGKVRSRFGPTLVAHRNAGPRIARFATIDEPLEARGSYSGGVEAIPALGHTDNNTCYRVTAQSGETYLFVGDVLFPSRGTWQAAAFYEDGGNKQQLKASLELLSEFSPDVVLFSATVADPAVRRFNPQEWRSALEEASRSLEPRPERAAEGRLPSPPVSPE